jgi:hypothetical protein
MPDSALAQPQEALIAVNRSSVRTVAASSACRSQILERRMPRNTMTCCTEQGQDAAHRLDCHSQGHQRCRRATSAGRGRVRRTRAHHPGAGSLRAGAGRPASRTPMPMCPKHTWLDAYDTLHMRPNSSPYAPSLPLQQDKGREHEVGQLLSLSL